MHVITDKLRSQRKQSPIMQSDIAFLLGFKDTTHISKFEKGNKSAAVDILLLYQILFDAPLLAYLNAQRGELKQHMLNKIPDLINLLEKDANTYKNKPRIECLQATFKRL